mmetsp:Transcript_11791/g.12950  ORF Transcript_11791/g.12950 Transcript_11791/m.12950 type:complete len:84 (+) Transcript_11791:467-718(+)
MSFSVSLHGYLMGISVHSSAEYIEGFGCKRKRNYRDSNCFFFFSSLSLSFPTLSPTHKSWKFRETFDKFEAEKRVNQFGRGGV